MTKPDKGEVLNPNGRPKKLVTLMKDIGYGAGYAYDHNAADGFSGQNYFPDGMRRPVYYQPPERGFERELNKRLAWFAKQRAQRGGGDG